MRYVSSIELEETAHILVGGAPGATTRLHLSNDKSNITPMHLKADLCAQTAFKFLAAREAGFDQDPVSARGFDGDRLVAIFALVYPEEALSLKADLISAARAFSFETFNDLDDAHRAFILRAWTEPDLSPLNKGVFQNTEAVIANILFEELLPRLPKILEKVDYLERYWIDEDRLLQTTEELFIKNEIVIEEIGALDLAIVEATGEKTEQSTTLGLHCMPIHNRTSCTRVLLLRDHAASFYYRAESGLDFHSRALAPRIDLTDLTAQLNRMEGGNGIWHCEPHSSFKPFLYRQGDQKSTVANSAFKNLLLEVLSNQSS